MLMMQPEQRRALREAVSDMANTPAGQTFLRWLVAETEVLSAFDRPPEAAQLAYSEGKRSIGVKTLELLRQCGALTNIMTPAPEENEYV